MGMSESAEDAGGRMKEAAGSLIGDEELKEEGAAKQDKAKAQQRAEDAEREAVESRKEAAAHQEREDRA